MPSISNINPEINIVRDDAVNLIMASIAMEELALAHILNAEGEKIQYVLGTLEGRDPGEVTLCDIMAVNESVHRTLRDVLKEEMLLQLKLEDAIELAGNADECQLTIRGTKTWRDGNNIADTRPATVTVNLLRDGEVYRTTTIDALGNGTYTFSCLPVWRSTDNRYVYTVSEAPVAGYTSVVNGNNIVNTVDEGSIDIVGSVVWADNDNVRQQRPENVTVHLLRDNERVQNIAVARPLVDTDDTTPFQFTGVPQFSAEGVPYVYTVEQEAVEGYDITVAGTTITNTFTQMFITVSGSKTWDDNDDLAGDRPDTLLILLLQNDINFRDQTITTAVPPETVTTFEFTNVPRFDPAGAEYIYTVDEAAVPNYTPVITDNNIVNTHN